MIRCQASGDVLARFLRARRLEYQVEAAHPHRFPHAGRSARGLEELAREKMEPQLSVGHHTQVSLTHHGENRRIGDGVGGEGSKLDPIVMEERPHEAAWGISKPVAMELDEADHIALRQVWLPVFC